MIIRPKLKAGFVVLPNALLNDKRLSADTRAMLAVLLSKPKGWELRPRPLRKLLSRTGEKEVGWTKLNRMFSEAMSAGYMARSKDQRHQDDGTWGKYEYIVGMPDDVQRAIEKADIAIGPCSREPNEDGPSSQNDFTNHKEENLERTESINSSHSSALLPAVGEAPKGPASESKRGGNEPPARSEVIQQRVAYRLGNGDVGEGWLLLGELSPSSRDALTALERRGHLEEAELDRARARAELARASKAEASR